MIFFNVHIFISLETETLLRKLLYPLSARNSQDHSVQHSPLRNRVVVWYSLSSTLCGLCSSTKANKRKILSSSFLRTHISWVLFFFLDFFFLLLDKRFPKLIKRTYISTIVNMGIVRVQPLAPPLPQVIDPPLQVEIWYKLLSCVCHLPSLISLAHQPIIDQLSYFRLLTVIFHSHQIALPMLGY